jgi:hypothetical protein
MDCRSHGLAGDRIPHGTVSLGGPQRAAGPVLKRLPWEASFVKDPVAQLAAPVITGTSPRSP